jgi:membrane-bound lytic murein transglycosylase F
MFIFAPVFRKLFINLKRVLLSKKIILIISLFSILFQTCKNSSSEPHSGQTAFFRLEGNMEHGRLAEVENFSSVNYFRYDTVENIFKTNYGSPDERIISPWDYKIKSISDSLKWDWRLLASLIYQESRFDPNVRSWAGACGLMQVMPETGKNFGIDIMVSPENNLKAGMLYINYLQDFFNKKIQDSTERLKFILAAYNAGAGNIMDAMKLAEKNGKNPLLWDENVAIWLQKKSEPEYYNDPVVKNGYCRGDEPVKFVSQVLERYSEYKTIIPAQKNWPF